MSYLTNLQPHEWALIDVMMRTDPLQTLALLAEQERSIANAAQRVYINQNAYNNSDVGMTVQHESLSTALYQPQPLVMQSNYDTSSSWDSFRSLSLPPPFNPVAAAVTADAAADLMAFSSHRRPITSLPKADDVDKQGKPATSQNMQNFLSAQAQESSSSASTNEYSSSDVGMPVKVGRIRYYDQSLGKYGQWQDILAKHTKDSSSETITLNLSRGGTLRILRNILHQDKRKELSRSMHNCKLYRQYSLSRNDRLNFTGFKEPRSHVLLSSRVKSSSVENVSNNEHPGYSYHGVQMKAFPIDKVPEVANYAEELARRYNLPLNQWDIGVDMIAYKDGGDSIGWHSDDTQGESIVVCVVVDAPGEIRPLHIRPNKRVKALTHGDEEIQLFIAEGDGYDMNGIMQRGYEHSLPKRVKDNSHRFVLIFRHGRVGFVPQDSGEKVLINEDEDVCSAISKLRPKVDTILFGHPSLIQEGDTYPRRHLWTSYAHRSDQRGINGNIRDGSDSIVVSRQSFDLREEDGLSWLRYTSSRRQGGGALCVSYKTKKPVRVFRSSRLEGPYRPPTFDEDRTSYRYDGLYVVTRVFDSEGLASEDDIPGSGAFTFHLERLSQPENALSTDDLFRKIQLSRRCEQPLPFAVPQPKNGGDVLPTLIESAPKVDAFRQPISIDYDAAKELERFTSAIAGDIAVIVEKYCERKRKDKTKKERKKAGLTTDIVHAIFACVIDNKSPPETDFKIIITEQSKLSPPPFDYHDGIYVLVDKDFPISDVLFDRVVRDETLCLLDGRWATGGPSSPNKSSNLQRRCISRKLKEKCDSNGKSGVIYTLVGATGKDWVDCRILHIYSCHSPKLERSKKLPAQEKLDTAVCSTTEEKRSLDDNKSTPAITFTLKEAVYAYDKTKSGVLYEAQVIKVKEGDDCLKYYVQYKGYKKSHNKWLSPDEMMKQTKRNHAKFLKSRKQSSPASKRSTKCQSPKKKVPAQAVDSEVDDTAAALDNTANIGEVGYKFRKEFVDGWHHGTIVEIRPNARSGKRYRCHYKDGDCEDLSIGDLRKLAKLEIQDTQTQTSQPRKTPVAKKRKSSSDSAIDEVRTKTKKKRQASPVRISSRRRQTFDVMEKVFAYDKTKSGVLYEAQVIKVKEGNDCLKYFVHYKGYKESHRKWLSAEEMMKMTAANRIQFDKSRM